MAFTKAQTQASLKVWHDRETAARKAWRAAKKGTLARIKAYRDLRHAKYKVRQRTKELAAFAPQVPKPELTKISPNSSSRRGLKPRLIVLHITVSHNRPGTADLQGILDFFSRSSTEASSHIVNDAEGNDARCVPDDLKAWTQRAFNAFALSIEQIQPVNPSIAEWKAKYPKQLENSAQWIAFWSSKYGIPLVHSTTNGVCGHAELGALGGGHTDCPANSYPFDFVIARAREIQTNQ